MKQPTPLPPTIPKCPWSVWFATGFGIGFAPVAPGTFGTLWGLPLAYGIAQIPAIGPVSNWISQIIVLVAVNLVGIPLCSAGAKWFNKKDPGSVVWDEIGAVPITLFLVPLDFTNPAQAWSRLALGFVLFRFFDILKPPPIRQLERLPDGLGIMADDWVAGIFAAIALRLLLAYSPAGCWWM